MPGYPRSQIVVVNVVGVYHCITRCVRRAFLCGYDQYSGKDYDHRKEFIRRRLQELASVFGIDICGYAVMGNHLHVVLTVRPDLAQDLNRLGLNGECWLETVSHFGRWFKRAAGGRESLASAALRCGRRWFQGQAAARVAFQ